MASASQTTAGQSDLKRAEFLKHELMNFVTLGQLQEEYKRQHKMFFEMAAEVDEREAESMLDWFLFDWFDVNGEGVINHFLRANEDLSEQDQEILLDWEDSLDSVFEIRSLNKNSLRLKDLGEEDNFTVITSTPLDQTPFKRGQFIAARLLPLGDRFIFSGLQFIMPDRESALEAVEMRRALDALNSPEAIEHAQREQCSAFCELYGCDELTVASDELNSTLQRFQQYVFAERRDPETGMTPAEKFQAEFGRELSVPDMPPLPDLLSNAGNVTILCDDFDGIVLLPDYNRFKSVFETSNPDKAAPGWEEMVWNYIKDPDIPIVAFEKVAEKYPKRVEAVLRKLIGNKDFSIEHLYAALLHYKQPIEGFDELEDDQQLWDLFDGNSTHEKKAKPASAKANGTKSVAENKSSEKKSAGNKSDGNKSAARKLVASTKTKTAKASKGSAKSTASKRLPAKGGKKTAGVKKAASVKKTASAKKAASAKKTASVKASAKSRPLAAKKAAASKARSSNRASAKKR
jgi:hypothetical protein